MHQLLNVQRSEPGEQEEQAYGEGGVAKSCDDECFACCANVCWLLVPEADEQETAEADALPSEVEEQQIFGEDEREHRRHEEIHVGEEARVACVIVHVFGGVEVNKEADKGDNEQH